MEYKEVKHHVMSVLRDLKEKSRRVSWQKNERQEWYVLFSASGFTDELREYAVWRHDLLLVNE